MDIILLVYCTIGFSFPDTLQQNNTYMRQLSVTLIEWQEEVVRAQSTYRNKFEKAKDVIVKVFNKLTKIS